MTEKELLELAAKAAGVEGRRYVENQAIQKSRWFSTISGIKSKRATVSNSTCSR